MNEIRVRIAPSPTGNLHIGTARSALFNYLYAKARKGKFILRIEDTDLERSDIKYEKDIIAGLKWLGLNWDEGPKDNKYVGEYGPYHQSHRTKHYQQYLKQIMDKKLAYHCFCTKEELEVEKIKMQKDGKPPIYSGKCRDLTQKEINKNIANGTKSIIRFRMPDKTIEFNDTIRGKLRFETKLFGDISIARDLNTPLYNLAVVIDDITMNISHVIRGEDHISNTPKQILLFEALNVCHPIYAHLPLILGPDKSKLSKRHGATSVIEFKKQGYLPEAMINFMALMGWNPKDNRELFTLSSLENEFDLSQVNKSGAIFNIDKLDSINSHYIKKLNDDEYISCAHNYLEDSKIIINENGQFIYNETGKEISHELIRRVLLLEKNRIKKFSDLIDLLRIFAIDVLSYDQDLLKWKNTTKSELTKNLSRCQNLLEAISDNDFNQSNIEKIIFKYLKEQGIGNGEFLWPMRVALSGEKQSPSPFELAEVLGKEKSVHRICQALNLLAK